MSHRNLRMASSSIVIWVHNTQAIPLQKRFRYKMRHSFSHKGSPYDNACIESFHAILKKEEVNHVQYLDFNAARLELFKYIEGWYNRKRIHGSIGYLTPQEKEELAHNQAA